MNTGSNGENGDAISSKTSPNEASGVGKDPTIPTCTLSTDFIPRDYQVELFQAALQENIIVYLPTGSGKTFIAALLIKEMGVDVTASLDCGGKRTIFLVPTVVLAVQQAEYLRRHTHMKVKEYYGSMGVDYWEKKVLKRPKILGLSAALIKKKCKPHKVYGIIQDLSNSMNAVVKTPSNFELVYRHATKPCELIFQYDDDNAGENENALLLNQTITNWVNTLLEEFEGRYGRSDFLPEDLQDSSSSSSGGDKSSILCKALKEINFLLGSFGPYGVYRGALVCSKVLQGAKLRVMLPQFLTDLDKLVACCERIRVKCEEVFANYSPLDRLIRFVQPRVLRLVEILKKFKPDGEYNMTLCGIIFVERRCTANVLYQFLKEIAQHDEELGFLKPLFIIGQAASRNPLIKDSHILEMRQTEKMKEFREGRCNLLVATSVLEEGVDIPACNVIIRFDQVKTYCDYVQTKGRARSSKAFYCLLVPFTVSDTYTEELLQYHTIEQQLLGKEDFDDSDEDCVIESACSHIIQPYAPFGKDGPQVTLQSAMSLINRYCGQLTSGDGVILAPKWTLDEVEESPSDAPWLKDFCRESKIGKRYQCRLILPLNSPMREEMVGDVMPSKRLAKRSVALKTCIKLHEMQELDDKHLLPVKLTMIDEELDTLLKEDCAEEEETSLRNVYDRHVPDCFAFCRPLAGELTYVYSIEFKLIRHCDDPSKHYFPFNVDTKLAILTSKNIPTLCPFPLMTRAGEFQVELVGVDALALSEDQLGLLWNFHRLIWQEGIYFCKEKLEFDLESAKLQFLVAPLKRTTNGIDFEFAQRIVSAPAINWGEEPKDAYHFDAELYKDAVVIPWYRPHGVVNAFYVDEVTTDMTPLSPFPEPQFANFAVYFQKKYKIAVTDVTQRLLRVSREISGKNFLISRNLTAKDKEKITHLVPELCHIHPLPSSVWKQLVWIPSVIHRLTGLLVAEELRIRIHRETNIGVEFLPASVNVASVWTPLQIRRKEKRARPSKAANPQLLAQAFQPATAVSLDPYYDEISLMWHVDYMESNPHKDHRTTVLNNEELKTPAVDTINDSLEQAREEQKTRLCFDTAASSGLYGPSPGLVLEALTLTRSNDGFDMERLETIGDSILKLVVTIYAYGQTASRRYDEGRLSQLRMQQVCNKHLGKLAQRKGMGSFIAGQNFDIALTFLPPGFKTPTDPSTESDVNPRVQQKISPKNVADCMEAIIGAYLLSTGIKGALKCMSWMGLKTLPSNAEEFNESNGFPLLLPSPILPTAGGSEKEMFDHLYDGLDSFEQSLNYNFKNKSLLIEALTHASYYPNRLTGSYQRLEFLGDAVLDYLVTRHYYEDERQYSPAMLTDLRSAVVNNETFAVTAVRNRFHAYFKHHSHSLSAMLDKFIKAQEANGHMLMHNYFVLEKIGDLNERVACNVDVPKVLGDIFESVAGAIFIDSGMSLDTVWRSYLPFLKDEMDKFNQDTPVTAVRQLHERFPSAIKLKEAEKMKDGRLCVTIEIEGAHVFKGAGRNSKTAKNAAAKYALSVLNNNE